MTRATCAIVKRACDLMQADPSLPLRAAVALAQSEEAVRSLAGPPAARWGDEREYLALFASEERVR